jgi:hypothetical protein
MTRQVLRQQAETLPGHQVPLDGTELVLWREFVLRGAGMPARWADELAAPPILRTMARAGGDDFGTTYEEAAREVTIRLQRLTRNPRFRAAVTLQHHRLVENWLTPFCGTPVPARRNRNWRVRTAVLSRYVQRYCMKNETIGFFGPVAWGEVAGDGGLACAPGNRLIRSHTTHFEGWAIDAVGAALTRRFSLRRWLAPKRNPAVDIDGTVALTPYRPPLELDELDASLISAADGRRTAMELAHEAVWLGLAEEVDQVLGRLGRLTSRHLLRWDTETPLGGWPERHLAAQLAMVGDRDTRHAADSELARLTAARDAVHVHLFDPLPLASALADLDRTFVELTGRQAYRRDGETAAGRTLVYCDSRRDVQITIGAELLHSIAPALSLVLRSARWYTRQVAAGYRAVIASLFDQERARTGSDDVPLSTLTFLLGPHLVGTGTATPVTEASAQLRARWDALLEHPTGGQVVRRYSGELAAAVRQEFDCSVPGWTAARYHSPDLLFTTPSATAPPGTTEVVLGELHVAVNTLDNRALVQQHDEPERLLMQVAADGVGPRVIPVLPKSWRDVSDRTYPPPALLIPDYVYWSIGNDPGGAPVDEPYPAAGLSVRRDSRGLRVQSRDNSLDADVIEVLGELLSMIAVNGFAMVEPRPHTPRVMIDNLVVARQTWRIAGAELKAAGGEAGAFRAAQQLAYAHGLPRRIFVKVDTEAKPMYVDLQSPPLVRCLVQLAARDPDSAMVISEMLPEPTQAWLRDAAGDRYLSEVRMVAVDRIRSDSVSGS